MAAHRFSLIIKVQREREDNLQAQFIKAQQYFQQAEQKYQGLANYRTEYIQQSQRQGSQGVQSRQYSQYVNFIGKLDQALVQQARVVHQAKAAAEQRKQSWLKMQTKRKALNKPLSIIQSPYTKSACILDLMKLRRRRSTSSSA